MKNNRLNIKHIRLCLIFAVTLRLNSRLRQMEDYHNLFLKQFRNYGFISETAEKDLLPKVERVHRTKGHRIIREGQLATSLFIVESGMVRSFYQKGKSEITIWFAYEGQKAVSISSLFANKPSRETVECVEDCNLLCISNRDLQELYGKYECMKQLGERW